MLKFYTRKRVNFCVIEQRRQFDRNLYNKIRKLLLAHLVSFSYFTENGAKLKVVHQRCGKAQDKVSQLGQYVLEQNWQKFDQQGGLILGNLVLRKL